MAARYGDGPARVSMLADLLSTVFERRYAAHTPDWDGAPMEEMCDALVSASGEVSGGHLAEQILGQFDALDDAGKLGFFTHLAGAMGIDAGAVRSTLDAYEATPGKDSYRAFSRAAEPLRQELIRRLNQVPGATAALVGMRADLLRLGRGVPELEALDLDFRHLFASWFNRGFLVLRPINWQSPAHLLEKIIAYEAVHEIESWRDLRRRVESEDRRCFAFFHPAMPDEPLIFVEVALTRGIPGAIAPLLAEARTPLERGAADTAVFYSISNCQVGLASISFGNSLIKQVAADLAAELPGLKTFVTLSPIPGLCKWLAGQGIQPPASGALAAHYLLNAKRPQGDPVDPVARFHLGNGARIHGLHAGADMSEKGRAQSGGLMVNYLYDLRTLTQTHEAFASNYEIAATSEIRAMAAAAQKTLAQGG